MYKNTKTLVKP